MLGDVRRGVRLAKLDRGASPAIRATDPQRPGEGCSRKRCTSLSAASARRTCRSPAGRRVRPNSASRGGSSRHDPSSRSAAHAVSSRSAGPGRPIRSRSAHHSRACQAASVAVAGGKVAGGPGAHHLGAMQRVAVKQLGEMADDAQPAGLLDRVRLVVAMAEVGGELVQPRPPQRVADHLEQRPHGALGQPRVAVGVDSAKPPRSRRRSAGAASGTATFAQTPSRRPGEAPSETDRRCDSQRSIPRVGTETTSGANGSARGVASSSPSASASPSARSARWMWSTPTDPIAPANRPSGQFSVAGTAARFGRRCADGLAPAHRRTSRHAP